MFKKIFIEKNILDHPRTKQIIAKYNNAEKVICNHYGEIFNLNNQSFRLSKQSKTLIIAKKNIWQRSQMENKERIKSIFFYSKT